MTKNQIQTVEEKLLNLYNLQYTTSQLDEINKLQGELPLEVKDMEDEISGLQRRKGKFQEQIDKYESDINKHKENIINANTAIEKYNVQLDNVKNNREYEALQKEIEYQSLEAKLSEKKINEITEKLEKTKELLVELDEKIESKKLDLEKKKSELDEIIKKTEKKVGTLERKIIRLEKTVDKRLLAAFKALRKRYRDGLAVVTVTRNACGGCFNMVPPQMKIEISQKKEIIACENCGRVLISDDLATMIDKKDRTVVEEKAPAKRTRRIKAKK
jgi:predicted  nucleic acid-binding Zn-ribbon protein